MARILATLLFEVEDITTAEQAQQYVEDMAAEEMMTTGAAVTVVEVELNGDVV